MKISQSVIRHLEVAGPIVDRLAVIAWAREAGDITENEYAELRGLYLWVWQNSVN